MLVSRRKKLIEVGIILLIFFLSAYLRFFSFGYPAEVVFDETYYGRFAAGYLTKGNVFSGHPPLGALLIAIGGWAGDLKDPNNFKTIGDHLIPPTYLYLRFVVGLAGALIPVVAYLLIRLLGVGKSVGLGVALVLIYENSLVVASRFAMPDSLLLLFGLTSLALYFFARKKKLMSLKILAAVVAGAAVSIKWTGLSYGLLIATFELMSILREKYQHVFLEVKKVFFRVVLGVLMPIICTYLLVYVVHFSVLGTLKVNNFPTLVTKAHRDMIYANTHMASHPAQSKWYEWPIMSKPISYWIGMNSPAGYRQEIFYTGNLFVYILSALAVLAATVFILLRLYQMLFKKRVPERNEGVLALLLLMFSVNFLPFIFITRPMFLYHYMSALVFAVMILFCWAGLIFKDKSVRVIVAAVVVIAMVNFVLTSPFTYGYSYKKPSAVFKLWNPLR